MTLVNRRTQVAGNDTDPTHRPPAVVEPMGDKTERSARRPSGLAPAGERPPQESKPFVRHAVMADAIEPAYGNRDVPTRWLKSFGIRAPGSSRTA